MGVALIVKPGLDRNFSVITFGIAQVAMDIEPGIGMLTDADVLHGPTHTLLGAIVIAMLVLLVAPSVCNYLLSRWNREVVHYKLFRELQAEVPSKRAMAIGAFFGTFSHVILDSLIHHDIQPLLPFTGSNPVQGMVTHDEVYQACVVAGVIGAVTWSAIKLARCATDVDGARAPLPAAAPPSVWVVWVRDLRFTWFCTLLLSAGPALLIGSGLFSVAVLIAAVLLGVPATVILIAVKGSPTRALRRLAVMFAVPLLTIYFVFQLDQQIPRNATPITMAIESYRLETGRYPESLEIIIPKHLSQYPTLRFSLIQPQASYRLKDERPQLRIPSSRGDAFANYEYNFDTRNWKHQD